MSRTIASRKELSHAIKRNRPQDSSGAKAEQIKEYEKRFEPEHPEPEPLPMQQVIQSLAAYGFSTDEAACAIAKAMAQKPEPLHNLTNNWRKMHGLPMHRKPAAFRRRRKTK